MCFILPAIIIVMLIFNASCHAKHKDFDEI